MAQGSEQVSCKKYAVDRRCYGCQRPLRIKDEPALWFTGFPGRAVYGVCCFTQATNTLKEAA